MATYILRRILIAIPGPAGDHRRELHRAVARAGRSLTARMDPSVLAQVQRNPQLLEERRHELGLDQPVPVRYLLWLRSAVQGDLGYSIQSHRPIAEEIAKRIPPTLALMARGDPDRDRASASRSGSCPRFARTRRPTTG